MNLIFQLIPEWVLFRLFHAPLASAADSKSDNVMANICWLKFAAQLLQISQKYQVRGKPCPWNGFGSVQILLCNIPWIISCWKVRYSSCKQTVKQLSRRQEIHSSHDYEIRHHVITFLNPLKKPMSEWKSVIFLFVACYFLAIHCLREISFKKSCILLTFELLRYGLSDSSQEMYTRPLDCFTCSNTMTKQFSMKVWGKCSGTWKVGRWNLFCSPAKFTFDFCFPGICVPRFPCCIL